MPIPKHSTWMAAGVLFVVGACGGGDERAQANPCAANPCAANPCNPCAGAPVDPALIQQGDRTLHSGTPRAQLVARGEELWNDPSLSRSGAVACATCHGDTYQQMRATFAEPYPHRVAMAEQRAGLSQVNAAEMVQLCMVAPMNNDPLPWESVALAALTAYVEEIQQGFDPSQVNPCAPNPCNPCAPNPCNPCAPNPCNPCTPNPCRGR